MQDAETAARVRACRLHALDLLRVYAPATLRRTWPAFVEETPAPQPELPFDEPAEPEPDAPPHPLTGCPIMPVRYKDVLFDVCVKHGVTAAEIIGPSRKPRFAPARIELYGRLHDELGVSFPQIGRIFGRDHTTVLYGVRRWRAMNGRPQ